MPAELKENVQEKKSIQQDIQTETVEGFLKSKIPDEQKFNKFNKAISDIKEESKGDIKEDDILNFLENSNLNWHIRKLNSLDDTQFKDYISGKIVDYMTSNGKTISVINEREEVSKDKEEVSKDKEEVSKDKEEVSKDKVNVVNNISSIEEINNSRTKAKDSYDRLDPKYKATDEQLANYKSKLIPSEVKDIEQKISGTSISLDEFLKLSYTYNSKEFKDDPKISEFKTDFKELKNKLNIVNTLSDLSPQRINKTAGTLMETNNNLKSYADDSEKFKVKGEAIKAPASLNKIGKDPKEMAQLFSKFADEKSLKQYKELSTKYKDHVIDDEIDSKDDEYQEYISLTDKFVESIQNKLSTDTQTIMKQRIISSMISGLDHRFALEIFKPAPDSCSFEASKVGGISSTSGKLSPSFEFSSRLSIRYFDSPTLHSQTNNYGIGHLSIYEYNIVGAI